MSETFYFEMFTHATLTTQVLVEADSLDEAKQKFVAMDKRDFAWDVADPSALVIKATVERIVDADGEPLVDEDWCSDDEGRWHLTK